MSDRDVTLSDGTVVEEQEENSTWTDGKSVVVFPDTAMIEVEVITADDKRDRDEEGRVVEDGED